MQPHALVSSLFGSSDLMDKMFLTENGVGTGEQMAHTLIASKTVSRMIATEDEIEALKKSIEEDFMG